MTAPPTIRACQEADMPAITAIYGHHVRHGFASFETDPPALEDMLRRRTDVIGKGLPYLVAEREGAILGYAYAGTYRARAAYRDTVENSIYLRPDTVGQGIGRLLLRDAERRARQGGAARLEVTSAGHRTEAHAFYRACGFSEGAVRFVKLLGD